MYIKKIIHKVNIPAYMFVELKYVWNCMQTFRGRDFIYNSCSPQQKEERNQNVQSTHILNWKKIIIFLDSFQMRQPLKNWQSFEA